MNIHIELVKKWLADPESVSAEELEENYAKVHAAASAAHAAHAAAYAAANYDHRYSNARKWVKRYEDLTKDTDA